MLEHGEEVERALGHLGVEARVVRVARGRADLVEQREQVCCAVRRGTHGMQRAANAVQQLECAMQRAAQCDERRVPRMSQHLNDALCNQHARSNATHRHSHTH